ncbi:ATP-binding protein [Chelativorans sp. Marseille-P2723]|uniref:ATP-binding protein n=1 Tax=Chelativorans sp. Marseille-P2723 TaxID=2709133 RepID=UPI0015713670|nr:ATP-binding protein [Chelativorans sp. Marseille-P2723]
MSAPFQPAPLKIITADERLRKTRGIKGVLTGISGIGKTSQLWTLDPERTLFVNLEAGELAVQGWPGDEIRVRDWERARDLACWIGGPNPAMREDQPYSQRDYDRVCAAFGDPSLLDKYDTIFVDSISVASRICMQWCKGQPQAQSDRSGKLDLRGAYGLLGQEMIGWLTHLQHTPRKNIWLVGLLDRKIDDFGKPYFAMQIEGSKTGLELPGIVDEVITLAEIRPQEGAPFRAFVCTTINDFGFPAKDRSGRLSMIEQAHLGRLMAKIRAGSGAQASADLDFDLPQQPAQTNPMTKGA